MCLGKGLEGGKLKERGQYRDKLCLHLPIYPVLLGALPIAPVVVETGWQVETEPEARTLAALFTGWCALYHLLGHPGGVEGPLVVGDRGTR